MENKRIFIVLLLLNLVLSKWHILQAQPQKAKNISLTNGQWFNGKDFERKTFYSVNGWLTLKKPTRLDSTIDLNGMYCVPPFAEAHNHNIDGAVEQRSRKAVERYLTDGVFYVKIQGNFPVTADMKQRLNLNQPTGLDVSFAQCFVTSTGGHPIFLHENVLLAQGYYPGFRKDTLQNNLYFTLDSEGDLEQKWPSILRLQPDFIKATLWCSDEFEKRKNDPAYIGRKGLDPKLLKKLVAKAHASNLRVSVHITNAADFHNAVMAGVDEIAHSIGPGYFKNIEERGSDPRFLSNSELMVKLISEALHPNDPANPFYTPITTEDAKLAAKNGITIITTLGLVSRSPEAVRNAVKQVVTEYFQLLQKNSVQLVIGTDNVNDTSPKEVEGLQWLGAFNNLTLLKLWVESTPRAIFPGRKIGMLHEGYEASFLALEGNPLEDLNNARKIKLRFKQGNVLQR